MPEPKKEPPQDPTAVLKTAIEVLNLFAQSLSSRLMIGEDGRLSVAEESPWKRVMGLARTCIVPLFSGQVKQEEEKRLGEIKSAILQARDTVKSHSALIEQFKEGNEMQRHLAAYALSAIHRYNALVERPPPPETPMPYLYNYERQRLLSDQDIKGQTIELSRPISVKYDSHLEHPAHKTLKELSRTFLVGAQNKTNAEISSSHKNTLQFMRDTFHMKAIRLVQSHLTQQSEISDILSLVKNTPIQIDEEGCDHVTSMRQLLEVGPGCHVLVTGCFARQSSDSKFVNMPLPESFRIRFQFTHSGFPYPSQHTGWALSDPWVNAHPLRQEQTPLFQRLDQRKRALAQELLRGQQAAQLACRRAKANREVFDRNRDLFLSLHRRCQEGMRQGMLREEASEDPILETFYQEAAQAPSAFDLLIKTQEQMLDLFVKQPFEALKKEWLGPNPTLLRSGTPQERFQASCRKLEEERCRAQKQLDTTDGIQAYIARQGALLGKIFQPIGLQYESEKMGFSPPLLSDFERKLQAIAFQQLMTFIDTYESPPESINPDQIQHSLVTSWNRDHELMTLTTIEEDNSPIAALVDELEQYFNARFYLDFAKSRKYTHSS